MTVKDMILELTKARKEARDKNGRKISQEQFCFDVGIQRYSLHSWEVGEAEPRLSTFINWAEALGYEVKLVKKADCNNS